MYLYYTFQFPTVFSHELSSLRILGSKTYHDEESHDLLISPAEAPKVGPEAYLERLGAGPWNKPELLPKGPQKLGPEGSRAEHSGRDHC